MRSFSFFSAVVVLASGLTVFAAPADQSWSCVRNERATANRVTRGIRPIAMIGLKLEIKDGQLKDGQILGWENDDNWKFTEPSPEGRNSPSYEASVESSRSTGDIVVINVNSDGWDHYNYTVRLNTKTGTALVDEAIQIDCMDPAQAAGVLTCVSL